MTLGSCSAGGRDGVDTAVVEGARESLDGSELPQHIITFPAPDRAVYSRESPFASTRIVIPRGRTRQARRFEMVAAADAVVSIAGERGVQKLLPSPER